MNEATQPALAAPTRHARRTPKHIHRRLALIASDIRSASPASIARCISKEKVERYLALVLVKVSRPCAGPMARAGQAAGHGVILRKRHLDQTVPVSEAIVEAPHRQGCVPAV